MLRRAADKCWCLQTSLQRQCCDLRFLYLAGSRFINVMFPDNTVSCLLEYIEWPGFPISWCFFFRWWHRLIPTWQRHASSGSNGESMAQGARDIIFTHGLASTVQILTPLRSFGMCWRRLHLDVQPSHHRDKIWAKKWICISLLKDRHGAVIKAKGGPIKY